MSHHGSVRKSGSNAALGGAKRVACIGECMVEFAHVNENALQMAFGGDTLNTAVYLTRLTRGHDVNVDYVTALGDDTYSRAMLEQWQEEGIGTGLVTRLDGRLPGLYTIRTDDRGERSFTYWREQAAVRDLLKNGRDAVLMSKLSGFDLLYLSGITLAVMDPEQRNALMGILDAVRSRGGSIAFDGNYRPKVWRDKQEAEIWLDRACARADIALPTLDDERALSDDEDGAAVASRLHDHGVREVVVKLGAEGCIVSTPDGMETVTTTTVDPVVDSTAAGDSFNAGYLAGRLLDRSPYDAAKLGHRLAGQVVRHHGALIPMEAMPPEIGC